MSRIRDYLTEQEIVGAVLVYREGDQCRWSLEWLYANCDRVCIVLDNHDKKTEKVVHEYRDKYPERTHIGYSKVHVDEVRMAQPGRLKRRFKYMQAEIRECVVKELRVMHNAKPIDILIWPDSDETFINEFPKYLVKFWESDFRFMMVGFLEVFESMSVLMQQKMAPHGRVFKYVPEMSVYPWAGRTRYAPYHLESRPWKLRHVVVHVCHLTEEYRKRRQGFDNAKFREACERKIWILPKDVREMTVEEIADYQPGSHQSAPKYSPITIDEFLNNNKTKPWDGGYLTK